MFDQPTSIPESYEEYAKLMFDLQVLAYQADLTRIQTFMLGRELSARQYPEIGAPDAHHPTSHHTNDPKKIANYTKINAFHTRLFAYYVDKLRTDGRWRRHSLGPRHAPLRVGYVRWQCPCDDRSSATAGRWGRR